MPRRLAPAPGFGRRLQTLRVSLGLTQGDFARVVGCTASAVGGWELEKRSPPVRVLAVLARYGSVTDAALRELVIAAMPVEPSVPAGPGDAEGRPERRRGPYRKEAA